jgi:hypothetical protein
VKRCAADSVEVTDKIPPVGTVVSNTLFVDAPDTNSEPNCVGAQYAVPCILEVVERFTQYPATALGPVTGRVQVTLTALLDPPITTPAPCTD